MIILQTLAVLAAFAVAPFIVMAVFTAIDKASGGNDVIGVIIITILALIISFP